MANQKELKGVIMPEDEELREKLDAWLRRLAEYGDRIENFPEREIQTRIMNTLLDRLGWETSDDSMVKYEVLITMGRETKRADCMLVSDENKCCVIETKAGNSTLDDEDARQSISYALPSRCPWAIVMNGRKLRLYDVASFKDNNPMNSLVMELEFLSDTQGRDNILNCLMLLAKDKLDSEEGMRELAELKIRRDIRKFIEDKKETILNEVIPEWVKSKRGEQINTILLRDLVNEIFREQPFPIPPQPTEPIGGLQITRAGDWEYKQNLGRGVFVYRTNQNKRINVDCSTNELREQLERIGLRCTTINALRGFYDNLRNKTEPPLIRRRRR